MPVYPGALRVADIHVSLCQGEKDSPEARFGGARTGELWQNPQLARVPLGDGSCLRRTGHPFTVSGPCGPSQKIECVFTASPETIRREPREFDLRRSVGNRRTWQSARCVILLFFPRRAAVSKRLRSGNLRRVRSRVARDPRRADTPPSSGPRLTSLDWHFPSVFLSHRPRPDYDPVWVPASRLPPAHAGYVCCAVWRCTRHFVSGALFIAAEPAVTDGLSDRGETRNLSHFQCPGQRCDRAHSRHCPEPFDSLR